MIFFYDSTLFEDSLWTIKVIQHHLLSWAVSREKLFNPRDGKIWIEAWKKVFESLLDFSMYLYLNFESLLNRYSFFTLQTLLKYKITFTNLCLWRNSEKYSRTLTVTPLLTEFNTSLLSNDQPGCCCPQMLSVPANCERFQMATDRVDSGRRRARVGMSRPTKYGSNSSQHHHNQQHSQSGTEHSHRALTQQLDIATSRSENILSIVENILLHLS